MQQMLLCISSCILNHSDNQESIHLFVPERSMNTHTHTDIFSRRSTQLCSIQIFGMNFGLCLKKKKSTLKQQSGTDPAVIWLSSQKSTICSNKTPLGGSHLKVTWKIILRWDSFIHVFYDLWWPCGSSSKCRLKIKSMFIQKMEEKISSIHPPHVWGVFCTPNDLLQLCHLHSRFKK